LDLLGVYSYRSFHGETVLGQNNYICADRASPRAAVSRSGLSRHRPANKTCTAVEA
jgi:hypothetical protein